MNQRPHHREEAFTLVELLVVIGIIAVLIGILLPTIAGARRQANQTACAATLRSLGQALTGYVSDYRSYPWGAYYDASALTSATSAPIGDGDDNSTLDYATYVWWSVIRGYMRGHGAPIANVTKGNNNQLLTRFMEAFSCPLGHDQNAGCDFVCNPVIMPFQITEFLSAANRKVICPSKAIGVYPDNIILFDGCELGDTNFTRQYVVGFDVDRNAADTQSDTGYGRFADYTSPEGRYRGTDPDQDDPERGDRFPINPGINNDSGGPGGHGQIRWRHGRNDIANFLFADGHVQSMVITKGFNTPTVSGEVLRKLFRPKLPPGIRM